MPQELILVDRVGKKFHRTLSAALIQGLEDAARRLLHLKRREKLGKDEFWALRDISVIVQRGECLGVIGPNGAGKTTLLKLIHRQYRPDAGRLLTLGPTKSLIRLGTGLQPLLSGRENIYIQCQQMGLDKRETDARLEEIIDFAGLEEAVDRPVKTYSDGMYARLEFSIATSVQADILLVDEVLAVGDIAFQVRALDRINQLKRNGAAIVFVSHAEMNVRHVADRCLLLFDGRQIALGEPDALFYQYYQSMGYLKRCLLPLGSAMPPPPDMVEEVMIKGLYSASAEDNELNLRTGSAVEWVLKYSTERAVSDTGLMVHFWNAADVLVASVDSSLAKKTFCLQSGDGEIRLRIPFVSLTPGSYRVAAGFTFAGSWLAYSGNLLKLHVAAEAMARFRGLAVMEGIFEIE